MRLRAQTARQRGGAVHILHPWRGARTVCGRRLNAERIAERSSVEFDIGLKTRLPDHEHGCANCWMLVRAYATPTDGWEVVDE